MQFRHVSGSPMRADADMLILCVFGEPTEDSTFKAVDKAMGGTLSALAAQERFLGKPRQSLVVNTEAIGASRVAVFGAGIKADFELAALRHLAARAVKIARAKGAAKICFVTPPLASKDAERGVQMVVEGALMGLYKFDKYRPKEGKKRHKLKQLSIITHPRGKAGKVARAAVKRGKIVAEAVNLARDYVNTPAADMSPSTLAACARGLARENPALKVKILSPKECEKLGMGMFLAVGRGAVETPRLIRMTYTPKKKATKRIALVGKGVMFDSGGYSLKPSAGMEDMKIDMSGAAAVVAAMAGIAKLGSPYEVHAVAACCENMVSGGAYKLGDVLTAMNGTTVEINNTDAEGRLTLGDALHYANTRIKPDEMFDFATLTGACVVALGPHTAGVMSNNDELAERWMGAAATAGESMWRLPLPPRLRDQLKSSIAEMRNTGERWGGALTAGLFLKHFAGDTPWVHVDLAGPASASGEYGATARGGTGFAVATIIEYLAV